MTSPTTQTIEGRIAPETSDALAAVLDVPAPADGLLPPLWHWTQLLAHPATRELGADGHPLHGIPAPPGPDRRRMFAGGRVTTHRLLELDRPATRRTWVASTVDKVGRSGPLTFVTVATEIAQSGRLAVAEEQDIVYRAAGGDALAPAPRPEDGTRPDPATGRIDVAVDEALLFRFSALTFNAHRIHYDRDFCRAEGYDDLVVHGPLQALMMGELLRGHGTDLVGRTYSYRLLAPMTGPQTFAVVGDGSGSGAEVYSAAGVRTAAASAGSGAVSPATAGR